MRLSMSMPPSNRSSASSGSDRSDSPSPISVVHEIGCFGQPHGLHEDTETSRHSSASATTCVDLSDIRELLLSVQSETVSFKEDQQALRKEIIQEVKAVREDVHLLHFLVNSLAVQLEEAPRGRSPFPRDPSVTKDISPKPPVVHLAYPCPSHIPSLDTSLVGHPANSSPTERSTTLSRPDPSVLPRIKSIYSSRFVAALVVTECARWLIPTL